MPYTINTAGAFPSEFNLDANAQGASASDSFDNDGHTYIHVYNGTAGPIAVAIAPNRLCQHGQQHSIAAAALAAGGRRLFGPFPLRLYGRTPTLTVDVPVGTSVYVFRSTARE